MKKSYRIILIVVSLNLITFVHANELKLISLLHERHVNVSHYQADFIQKKHVSYISKPLITTGRLEFALGYGLIWEVTKPLWVKTLITDSGIYKSTKYQKKLRVKDFQIKLIAEIMTELLSANLNKIESQFKITPVAQDNDNTWRIDLTPKKAMLKKALEQVSLKGFFDIDRNNIKGINEIIITDKSGNVTQIKLNNIILYKNELTPEIKSNFN